MHGWQQGLWFGVDAFLGLSLLGGHCRDGLLSHHYLQPPDTSVVHQ